MWLSHKVRASMVHRVFNQDRPELPEVSISGGAFDADVGRDAGKDPDLRRSRRCLLLRQDRVEDLKTYRIGPSADFVASATKVTVHLYL